MIKKHYGFPADIIAYFFFILVFILFLPSSGISKEVADLTELSIEDLMDVEITSVSKKPQRLSAAAAAAFVITGEDLRRSGVNSLPEALRMVPGLQVARIDANNWAISSRGFNGAYANKLLVLIDGRSVYTPLFSGVYWGDQDTILEDIDRIEVIRGPGAALWGANAVNGVINIITKHTGETLGGLATAGSGTEERGFGSLRWGGKLDDDVSYRVYAKYAKRDESILPSGDEAADSSDLMKSGFRMDWKAHDNDSFTLMGDVCDGKTGETISVPVPVMETINDNLKFNETNLLGRWERIISDSSGIGLQLYYDRTKINSVLQSEIRDTLDLDFQNSFGLGDRHGILWGMCYRFTRDNIDNTPSIILVPDRRQDNLFSCFLQDDINLIKDTLCLTLGSKFEHNDYTGLEIQPNARLIWTPNSIYSIWTAVSRAVRTPSRAEHDIRLSSVAPDAPGGVATLVGSSDFVSEELIAYEIGYRVRPVANFSVDIATFYNDYNMLRTLEIVNYFPFEQVADNKMKGHTYGVELTADWRAMEWWRLQGAYTYLKIQLQPYGESNDPTSENPEGESPHHQFSLRSSVDITENLELDLWARYLDGLPAQRVDSYVTLDVRLGWKLNDHIELSIVGQNLLDDRHPEFVSEIISVSPTECEHSLYGKIIWRF